MKSNLGSFVRIVLSAASGWLARGGWELDDGTVELIAAAIVAVVAAVSAVLKNRKTGQA